MNRSATASLHSATPKKNVPCFSDVVVVNLFLKKERTFFFGVLPSRSRAGGETMWTKFCKNYFLGKGFCKTSAHLFLNSGGRDWKTILNSSLEFHNAGAKNPLIFSIDNFICVTSACPAVPR